MAPRMLASDGRVVSNFVVQALQDKPLTVYGKGNQTRSFCYVTDTVDGLIRLMNHPTETGPVNIGNPSEFTVLELAEMVRKMIKPSLEVVFKELPKDDPTRRKPDVTKAKNVLGWEPKVKVEDGLQKTIEYFKNELKSN
jgi:UDP-glucuronate decarboxylase